MSSTHGTAGKRTDSIAGTAGAAGTATAERRLDLKLLARLLGFVRGHPGFLALAVVLLLATDALRVLGPYLLKVGIDRDLPAGDIDGLARTATLLGAALLGQLLTQVGFTYTVEYLGQRLLYDLRMSLFGKLLRLGQDYFDRTPVGRSLTNVTSDVEAIRQFIAQGVVSVLGDSVQVVVIFTAMLLIDVPLALVTFATLPLFLIITLLFRNAIRRGFRGVREANALINTTLVETITGIREVTLLNHQQRSMRTFAGHNRRYLDAYLRVVHSYSYYFPTLEMLATLSLVVILCFAHLTLADGVQPGEVFAFFAYVTMLYRPLRQLAERFNTFQAALAAAERIFALLDRRESIGEPTARRAPVSTPSSGPAAVALRNVGFGYQPAAPVLHDVSLTVAPGERVALVGSTGSGKTTVVNLINRLYDVQQGVVELDGTDVRLLPSAHLRRRIATVPQDLFLFSGSVADNIALRAPEVGRARVEAAAAEVHADRFIGELPHGFDEDVLEQGRSLSTGQKQLLSFARAFVLDPGLVIMDEATASVDAASEQLIEAGLARLLRGRSALIIAHRLATIRAVDRIVVLHHGAVVETGSHAQLLARDGRYARLYRMQLLASDSGLGGIVTGTPQP